MHRRAMSFLCVLCASVAASAATLDASLIQTSGLPSVGSGKFYGYQTPAVGPGSGAFSNAYNKAVSEGVPLVVVWSNDECSHCNDFTDELNMNKAEVSAWLASREAVFVFFKDHLNDSSGRNAAYQSDHASKVCYDAWSFAANKCGAIASWPLFAFYYERTDGTQVVWGTPKDTKGSTRTWSQFKKWYEEWTAANGINEKIGGGKFAVSDTEFDRYEAEPSTEYVDIELVRDVERSFSGGRDLLVAVYPGEDGLCLTNAVEWAASETSKVVRIAVVPPGGHYTEGTTNTLVILDKEGEAGETAHIVCRGPVENSNNNPLWLGERRTPDDLAWGEWTVDLDVATNKVAAAEGEAYTIVSVQGSLWCPDCANTDANFLDLVDGDGENRFRKWAAANHVALAVVDVPNYSARNGTGPEDCKSPSMFSRTAYMSRSAMRSGRPYLSRKMVSDEAAAAMRARNHFFVTTNTDAGGYHRPEDTNAYRTGVPIFVLLRKDGTVAARLIRFAAKSPGVSDQANWSNYIARFDEMLSLAADEAEIGNNHQSTTAASLTPWSPISASLSHVDTQDFALVPDASAGSHIKLSLSSESTSGVTLAIVSASGQTLASKYGPIGGLVLEADVATAGDRWFAKVSCSNTDKGFAVDEAAATVAAYELSMESYIQPQEKAETNVPSGDSVVFRVVSGEPYRFRGLVLPVDGLESVEGYDDLYRATVSGDVSIKVEDGAKSIEYQLWHPGTVEFTRSEQDVYAHMGDADIKVRRTGGVSGAKTEYVRLVSADELAAGRYVWSDAPVSWDDGEGGEKSVSLGVVMPGSVMHAPGELVFGVCGSRLVVTLLDKDAPGLEFLNYDSSSYRYFSSDISFDTINLLSRNHVSVRVLSGSLPPGTRLLYDEALGRVELLGEPVVQGDYEFTVALAEIRDGRYVVGPASTVRVKVEQTEGLNAYLTRARENETLPLYADRGGTSIIAGTLSIAITSHGRISARYVGTEARTAAFSGAWQELDDENTAYARLVKGDCILDLALDADGVLHAELEVPPEYSCFAGAEDLFLTVEAAWPQEDPLDGYAGIYNVALPVHSCSRPDAPSGTGILALRMSPGTAARAGRFTYSGFMPDGTPLNGSVTAARAVEYGREFIRLPIFRRVGRNIFSATLTIDPEAALKWDSPDDPLAREAVRLAEGTMALSVHRDAAWEYEAVHNIAVGSYYLPGVSPLELSEMFYTNLYERPIVHVLRFDTAGLESPAFGSLSVPEADIIPSGDTMSPALPIKGLTFAFKSRTGMFSGSAVVTFTDESGKKKKVTGSYRGVLTPGWVRNCDCGDMVPEWYFGSGFLRYRDFNVEGRPVMKSLPVVLDPDSE